MTIQPLPSLQTLPFDIAAQYDLMLKYQHTSCTHVCLEVKRAGHNIS